MLREVSSVGTDLLEEAPVFHEVLEEIEYTLHKEVLIAKGGNTTMQGDAQEEKIVQVSIFTRPLRSHSDSAILELTVTLIPNCPCRFDINILYDPNRDLSRDTRVVLEKDRQLQLREELAANGFIMVTASTHLDGYGGNTIFLTATNDRSRLAVKSYSREHDGVVFQVTIDHMRTDQQGQAVALKLSGLQALLCQLALESYVDHPGEIMDIVGYGVEDEDALTLLQNTIEQIGPQVHILQNSREELLKFAHMLRIQRWPEGEEGRGTIREVMKQTHEQEPPS
jgi:hypothetical protein